MQVAQSRIPGRAIDSLFGANNVTGMRRSRIIPANAEGAPTVPDVFRGFVDRMVRARGVTLSSVDPEGPHQLRVGLRKLRTGLSVFARNDPEALRLREEAKWLASEVGELRDHDVVRGEMVQPLLMTRPDDKGLAALDEALAASIVEARAQVRGIVIGPRASALFMDASKLCEPRLGDELRLAGPIADAAFLKRLAKARKLGKRFRKLSEEQRHEFRKELKKLRYTLDCGAWPATAKGRKLFVKHLKTLQESLGAMNDAVVARHVLDGAARDAGKKARKAARAIVKGHEKRAAHDLAETSALWKKLIAQKIPL